MLIQFSVRNYKTFREKATLSLVASAYDKTTHEEDNVIVVPQFGLRLLKSAVVYGANASGKTKLVEALKFMKRFIQDSSVKQQKGDPIEVEPFRLNTMSELTGTEFEVIFIHDGAKFRYGFEVTSEAILAEWLYHQPKNQEVEIFYRERQKIDVHQRSIYFNIGRKLAKDEMVKENTLLISLAAQFNDLLSGQVLEWFRCFNMLSGLRDGSFMGYTLGQLSSENRKTVIMDLMQSADLGIENVEAKSIQASDLSPKTIEDLKIRFDRESIPEKSPVYMDVTTSHPKFNEEGTRVGNVAFSMVKDESSGTQKYLAISGPVIDVLENGYILVVDELDARLHPNLVCKLISLFNSKSANPRNAQLIFNTHDTNLLSGGNFRRDQIWFTEKDRYGAATLYSLSDFSPRKGEDLEKNYIQGKYGAVPYLGDFDKLLKRVPAHYNEE